MVLSDFDEDRVPRFDHESRTAFVAADQEPRQTRSDSYRNDEEKHVLHDDLTAVVLTPPRFAGRLSR